MCDDAGDLYFQPSGKADSAIFKLSQPDESNSRMFQIPSEGSESDSLIDYTVTPSGALYVLAQDVKQKFHVYSFEPDGGVKHNVKLETPDYALLVDFAVFDNDTILGTGYYQRDAPGTLHGKSYAVLFDQSGQLLKDMTSRFSLDATSSDQTGPLNHISIRPGKDGNLYLLGSSAVLVISPSGEIIRRIKFVKPDPATAAVGLEVADGLVSIELGDKPAAGKPVRPRYLVLDATSGKEYGYFAPPEEVKGKLGRFSREEGFIFVAREKGNLKLISAKMN